MLIGTPVVVCMHENDPVWWLPYPDTPVGVTYNQTCPQNGTSTVIGKGSRCSYDIKVSVLEYHILAKTVVVVSVV